MKSKPRVVLLSKAHPLTTHMEQEIARTGTLVGIAYEERLDSPAGRFDSVRRVAKRENWLRAIDVVAYELYERVARRASFQRAEQVEIPHNRPAPDMSGIPRATFGDLNDEAARQFIASLKPDILVVHATGILKQATFGLAELAINVHGGFLPEYRGHASTFWALHNRDINRIGVTVHEVAAKVDTGRALRQGTVRPANKYDDDITLWFRAIVLGTELVVDIIRDVAEGRPLTACPTEGPMGPHYRRKGLTDYIRLRSRLPELRRQGAVQPSAQLAASQSR